MSKTVLTTRQLILATALQAFNKQGIDAVGVRDLAALLKLSAGNVTYYFPTRDEMVKELVSDLDASMRLLTDKVKIESVSDFIAQQKVIMDAQFHNRSLYLAYGTLMMFNKKVASGFKKLEKKRNEQVKSALQGLAKSASLEKLSPGDLDALVGQIQGFSNSWIAGVLAENAAIKKEQAIKQGAKSFAFMLNPYLTKSGKGDLAKALKSK
jgi:AcrR family transcriptional regulator